MATSARKLGNPPERNKMFSHPLHANGLLSDLNETRKIPSLCDGLIVINGKEILIQRNVLSAASPYFRALFSYEITETKKPAHVEHPGLTIEQFEQILDFIYTSKIELDEENIQGVLQAADLFLMQDLKQLCCEYLEECICNQNVLGIRDFALSYSCPRVFNLATQYMDEHFCDIMYCDEFMELSVSALVDLLKRVSLRVRGEAAILEAILVWVRHNMDQRRHNIKQIITDTVRLECLKDSEINHLLSDELVNDLDLGSWILEQKSMCEGVVGVSRGYTNMMVLVGGEGVSDQEPGVTVAMASVYAVDIARCLTTGSPNAKVIRWLELAPTLTPRSGHGVCAAGGWLFAIGGRDHTGEILRSGEKYDPATNTWYEIAPMNDARIGFGLVNIEDKLYAIGASNDMSDPTTSVEEYNIYTNKWRRLPDMNLKRAWSAVAVVDKKIFVMGGGILGRLYEAVECFDLRSETWMSVASMKERRFDARAIGYQGDVFVFGGLRRFECPSAMHSGSGMKFCGTEVYSTEHKQWTARNHNSIGLCSMNEASHIDSVLELDNRLLVIGDLEVGGQYHYVRSYTPATNSWRGVIVNSIPGHNRCSGSGIVKIPNIILDKLKSVHGHPKQ